jgi:hypothetical protein
MKMITPKTTGPLLMAALCMLLATPTFSAAGSTSLEAIAIEAASTPEQFQALADHYKGKAAQARANAGTHKAMASSMVNSKSPNADSSMRAHCEQLVATYEKAATEYEAMAAAFEAKAKK